MLSYLIVGSGYRAEYFARIAVKHPDLFRAKFLCRSAEKAALVTAHTGVAATTELDAALAFRPDFVVVAVDWGHVGDVTEEWALRGFPVVAETPVGSTEEKLKRLWALQEEKGAKIVCSEQYHRHPVLAEGFAQVRAGVIGEPISAYLSLAHDYHGMSLIRRMLLTEGEDYTLRAERRTADVVATDSRYGAIRDGSLAAEERTIAHIAFDSGKTAVYDFAPLQYRTFIRSRHLSVRGERGEWSDRIILYADGNGQPRRTFLMPEIPEKYRRLDNQALRDIRKTFTGELFLDTEEDEYAIATLLLDMEDYIGGGPSPYPLREALDDAWFCLMLSEAAKRPWEPFRAENLPWR